MAFPVVTPCSPAPGHEGARSSCGAGVNPDRKETHWGKRSSRGTGCNLDHNLEPARHDRLELMVQINSKQRDWIMPALFDLLYREYCRARLAEMRKQLLISPNRHEVPEAFCDAKIVGTNPADDSETATQHEPLNH
jgi:hypothetical protein